MSDRAQALVVLLIAGALFALSVAGAVVSPAKRIEHAGTTANTCRIDPNTADAQTLCLLPRIGPGIAHRLVDDRQANGPFQNAADLTRVSMIGDKTVQALRPWVSFGSNEQ